MFQNIATFAGQPETIREFRHAMEVSRVDTLTPEEQNQYHDAMVSEYEKLVISEAYEQIGLKKGREEGRAEGRAEGIAEGRAEGMEQGKMEVARQMKKMGLSIAQIVQASGLPEEIVKGL
jgi:predicted transposase/invertase (TIGR01784 family)